MCSSDLIDSPGGTTAGSEAVYDAVRRISERKPVVAVMDTVAASGGYITALAADRIVGVEAPLWTEKVPTFDAVEHLCFPRLLCLAEVGWTPQPMRQWDDFRVRLQHETNRLAMEGVNVHRSKLL